MGGGGGGLPHNIFATARPNCYSPGKISGSWLCETELLFTSQNSRHPEVKLLFASKCFRHCEKVVIHVTKFSTVRQNCNSPHKTIGTVRRNCDPPPSTKFSVLWKTLNFKMMSFCIVDPRCGSNFLQCICNGV